MTAYHDALAAYRSGDLDWDGLMEAASTATDGLDKSQGAVYTPRWIVERLLDGAGITPEDTVLEPSCGRGAFLVPVLERVRGQQGAESLLSWANTHLVGLDIDAHAVEDARATLSAWFARAYGADVPASAIRCIHHADALAWTPPPGAPTPTVVVGNPPYVRFQNLDPSLRADLARRYASCASGNVDLYYAFMEQATRWAPRTAFVVPHGFLTTRSGRALRQVLDGQVIRIEDYGVQRVFPGVGTYVALVFLDRRAPQPDLPVHHVPSGIPRPFLVDPTPQAAVRRSTPGIATLCDSAFAVERHADGRFVATATGLEVEPALVRPLVKITTLHRHDPNRWTAFVLYPYGPDSKPLDEGFLRRTAPKAMAHLDAVRHRLDARDKGDVADYPAWYAYGRSQGLAPTNARHVLVVPAMIGGAALPRLFDTAPLAAFGRPVFVSGHVVDHPTPEDIAAILSPGFLAAAAAVGAPRPGKDGTYHSVASSLVKSYTPG